MTGPELESAVILCGGMGRRMGAEKGLLEIEGEPFIVRISWGLMEHFQEVLAVFRDEDQMGMYADILDPSIRLLTDEVPGLGPLGGILTGLENISTRAALFVPCDSPLITGEFMVNMKAVFSEMGSSCDVIVPENGGRLEPLHAVYSRSLREDIRLLLSRNKRRVGELIESVNSCPVPAIRLDPSLESFRNFNRPEDLRI